MTDTAVAERQAHPVDDWATPGYTGPQPWDHDALGIPREDRDLAPGEPNTVTPVITHPYPILTHGSSHQCVHELGRKLADLGYPSSVSRGENPFGTVDASLMTAVAAFRAHHGVEPDPSGFGGNNPRGRALAAEHLDPWTVEGILRAHKHLRDQD